MNKEEARSVILGAISMALTDPVLQQGFENICNENKELKTVKIPQLERRIASIRGAHSVDCKKLNARTEQVERQKKRIAELEKENNRLSRKCECLTKNNESLIDVLNDVERLEKENSELKESNKSYEEIIDHSSTALMKEKLKNYKQLTKAKEIIKKFLLWENDWHNKTESKYELLNEAEQFLKGE